MLVGRLSVISMLDVHQSVLHMFIGLFDIFSSLLKEAPAVLGMWKYITR